MIKKRLLAVLMVVVMLVGMIPAQVFATEESQNYGTVSSLTEGVTISQDGADVNAAFAGTLQWVAADPTIGRMQDGWWVGIKLTVPEGMTQGQLQNVQYTNNADSKSFWSNMDSQSLIVKNGDTVDSNAVVAHYITLWGFATPEYLQTACQYGGRMAYIWTVDWDNDGNSDQTVTLSIDAVKTVLIKDGQTQYCYQNGTVEGLTEGVTVSQSDETFVAAYAGTLQWVSADSTVGRMQDGWWVGIKVTAPAYYNTEKAVYKSGEIVSSFKESKSGENDIELWSQVTPEALQAALNEDGLSTFTWQFNWDGSGDYEQTVQLNIDANSTTLMHNGVQHYPADLGTVSCYTDGASIAGNGTGDVKVTIEQAELVYAPADPSIGRNEAGWWAGIKVTVPEALKDENSEEVLRKIKLQVKGDPAIDWKDVEEKDFYDFKDSSSAPHYIQMWVRLTPLTLAQFISQNKSLTMCYRFNWDGENDYDQEITFSVLCSDKIKLLMDGTELAANNVKAFVNSDDTTKVSFTAVSTHGVQSVTVDGENVVCKDSGVYEVTLDGAKETVTIVITDIYGNEAKKVVSVQPKLEVSIEPSSAIKNAGGNYYYNAENPLTFTIITNGDNGAYKVSRAVLTANNGEYTNTLTSNADGELACTVGNNCALSGLKVWVEDATGRTAEYTLTDTYVYDTEAPRVSVEPSENIKGFYSQGSTVYAVLDNPVSIVKNNSVKVSFTVTVMDQNLNPELYPAEEGWTIKDNTASKIFSADVADHNNGEINLSFTAVDQSENKAGNTVISLSEDKTSVELFSNQGVYHKTIMIDRRTPGTNNESAVPEIKLSVTSQASNNKIFYKDFVVFAALKDNGSGIKRVTYNLVDAGNGVNTQLNAIPEIGEDGRYQIPVYINEGCESDQVKLTLVVTDNVGNSYEFNKNFSVDKKAPDISLTAGAVSDEKTIAYYQNQAEFQFSVTDLSGCNELEWNLNDGANGQFLELKTEGETAYVTIREGAINETTATLTLIATDTHGHASEAYTISFVVDNKAPEVEVTVDAKDYVQTVKGVDYFKADVEYKVSVSDRYLIGDNISAVAVFENGISKTVNFSAAQSDSVDSFTGSFKVTDGQILKNIQISVIDNTGNYAKNVKTQVENSEEVTLVFAAENNILSVSSNDVVVDTTAPEVLITVDAKDYIQTRDGVDYFNQEVPYNILVSDMFMEDGTYTLEAKLFYEGVEDPEIVELVRDEGTIQQAIGNQDTFTGSFTLTDGKVLTDIQIDVLDAAKRNPDEIKTVVENSENVVLNFGENESVWNCTSNDVCVDKTPPVVTVTASENVTGLYFNEDAVYAILKDPIFIVKNSPVTVSFTVTVEDESLDPLLYPVEDGWSIAGNVATKVFSAEVADHNNGEINISFATMDLAKWSAGDTRITVGKDENTASLVMRADENGVFTQTVLIDRRTPGTNNESAVPEIKLSVTSQTSNNGIFYKDFVVFAALKDNGSGIKSVTYNLVDTGNGVNTQLDAVPEIGADGRYQIPVHINEGCESDQVKLTLVVTDNVGNSYEFNKNFSVDKKTPSITLEQGEISDGETIAYYQNQAEFQFSVTDLSGYTLEWNLDDGAKGQFLELTTEGETAYVTIRKGAINEVKATLTLTATDTHDHASEAYTISFVVDNKAPEVEVTVEPSGYVQTVNDVDYFNADVIYNISVSDRFMELNDNVLNVLAIYEDGTFEKVTLNRTSGMSSDYTEMDSFAGSFSVTNGKVLTDIQFVIVDNTKNKACEANAVTNSQTVSVSFAVNEEGVLSLSSNKVVVDTTAPEVLVTIDAKDHIQTVNGVDYFNQEVIYNIEVTDKFMEEGTYKLEAKAIYEDGSEEVVPITRTSAETEVVGAKDIFVGSFTVTDGKVLTNIHILVKDAACRTPDEIQTEVANSETVTLTFGKNGDLWSLSSNKVVADTTAPEVLVTIDAKDHIQTVNGVDYFNQEVIYNIEVTDKFMEEGTYKLEAKAIYEDNSEEVVSIIRTSEETRTVGSMDTFAGRFTVTDGKVLTSIHILVKDAAERTPDEIQTEVKNSETVTLTFDKNGDLWSLSSNKVVVDTTAPEVLVTTNAKDYVQTYNMVDYFNQEVTYYITVSDKFMEENTYTLEAKAFFEGVAEPVIVELVRDEETTQQNIGDLDAFIGSFTVTDGKVLTDIQIDILDAANWNPDEVKTAVMLSTAENETVILSFTENADGIFFCTSHDVCVDMTAPTVEISFSENVTQFYYREEVDEDTQEVLDVHYFADVSPEVEGEANQQQTGEKLVEMTITIRDSNITMDGDNAVAPYYIVSLLEDENANWFTMLDESGETVITYYTSIVVKDDTTAELPFDIQVYDLAGNAAESVSLVNEGSNENYTLPGFAEPAVNADGIITVADTIIIDCRRSTSENQAVPDLELVMPDTDYTASNGNQLYNGNVTFSLDVMDNDWNNGNQNNSSNNSAGIAKIEWAITNAGEGYLKEYNVTDEYNDEPVLEVNDYLIPLTLVGVVGEYNEVTLVITVTDKVQNKISKSYVFALDNQAPRINVEYNNPAGNSPYFRETRTAVISVEDINFNAEATKVWVQPNTERSVNWVSADSKTYVGTVIYAEEGDYEFSMETTDLAGNKTTTSKGKDTFSAPKDYVTINGPENATHVFTIDKTAPTIAVVYSPATPVDRDEEGVEYFDTDRSAEVTITDVNFTAQETKVTAGDQSWTHPYRGQDNKYGTVFGEGNNYQVEVTSADKAGNVATPYKGVPFSVDKTKPTIQITTGDMTNEGLNIVQDDLILGFTINDTNSNLKTTNVVMTHLNNEFKPVTVTGDAYYEQRNELDRTTRYVDVTNIAKEKLNDGIYTIEISALDYAGRTEIFVLYMSVNRFGSSFIITDAYTKEFFSGDLNAAIYHNAVENNLIIQEINPNAVWQNGEEKGQEGSVITMAFNGNAKELIPNTNYSVTTQKMGEGKNTWYVYTYEIFKENFYANDELVDGRYKLLFYSEDEAGNRNANETNADSHLTSYEDGSTAGTAEFVLDHQKPIVAIIGITSGQEISEDNQVVEITIADNTAVSIVAYIDDTMIELGQYSENMPTDKAWFVYNEQTGKYMLNVVKSNKRQNVKLVATDAAGNEMEYYVNRVLVTKNVIVQYFNNVPALCITAVVLIAAVVFFIILKKKKKEENKG